MSKFGSLHDPNADPRCLRHTCTDQCTMLDACTLLAFTHVLTLLHHSGTPTTLPCLHCTSADELPFFPPPLVPSSSAGARTPLLSMEPPGKARQERPRLPIRVGAHACISPYVAPYARVHHATHSENERKAPGRPVPSRTAAARLSCRPTATRAPPSAASTMPPLETTTEHCRLLVDRSIQSNYYSPAGPPALAFPRRALCTACIIIAFAWKELAKACPALAAASFLTLHTMFFFLISSLLAFCSRGVFNQSCLISMRARLKRLMVCMWRERRHLLWKSTGFIRSLDALDTHEATTGGRRCMFYFKRCTVVRGENGQYTP